MNREAYLYVMWRVAMRQLCGGYAGSWKRGTRQIGRNRKILAFVLGLLFEFGDDRGIGKRCRVPEDSAFGNISKQAAHDLGAARFGQLGGKENIVGLGDRADFRGDVIFSSSFSLSLGWMPSFSVTNAEIPRPLISCVLPITAASATEE